MREEIGTGISLEAGTPIAEEHSITLVESVLLLLFLIICITKKEFGMYMVFILCCLAMDHIGRTVGA